MKNVNKTVGTLTKKVNSLLSKSRDALSDEDIQTLKEVKHHLRSLKHSPPAVLKSKVPEILGMLVKFLLKPEVMEPIQRILKRILDKF